MLDLHAHVLPGIDDGPRTMDESFELLQGFVADGVTHVVATPHIYPGVFDNHWAGIAASFNRLADELDRRQLPIGVSFAAEVRLCGEMIDWLHNGDLPVLAGLEEGAFSVLVELPDGVVPVGAEALLAQMVRQGLTPIIAHPERNRAIMESPAKAEALVRVGCKLQLTAGSLLGEFGERAQVTAIALLESGHASLVASDAHNMRSRAPRLGAARRWLAQRYGEETALNLTQLNPMAVAGRGAQAVRGGNGLVLRELPLRFRPAERSRGPLGPVSLQDLPPPPPDPVAGPLFAADASASAASPQAARTAPGIAAEWLLPALRSWLPEADFPETQPMSEADLPRDPFAEAACPDLGADPAAASDDLPSSAGEWAADAPVSVPAPLARTALQTTSLSAGFEDSVPVLEDAVSGRTEAVVLPFASGARAVGKAVGTEDLALSPFDPVADRRIQ